jgi:hypothetical protein
MRTQEVAPGTYRIESSLGTRPFAQYQRKEEGRAMRLAPPAVMTWQSALQSAPLLPLTESSAASRLAT